MATRILAKRLRGKRWQLAAHVVQRTEKAVRISNGTTSVWLPKTHFYGQARDSEQLIASDWIVMQKAAAFDLADPDGVYGKDAEADSAHQRNRAHRPRDPDDYFGPDDEKY